MNWKTSKFLVIAHRGDTKAGVENTLPAMEAALRLGVDGIETDLRLTRDDEIVLFHDDDLQRLAGRDLKVEESTLGELKGIRISGGPIPTLEELLDLAGEKALLNLEIKTVHPFNTTLEKKLVRLLKTFRLSDSILVSSFHPLPLWRLKRLAPGLPKGYLFASRLFLHRRVIPWIAPFSVNAPLSDASQSLAETVHRSGMRFFVWTVNDQNDMQRTIEMGADGLITDEPRKLLALQKRVNDG